MSETKAPARTLHLADRLERHTCGGTVLSGDGYLYCDKCGAFAHDASHIPSGASHAANLTAWDAGDPASPD